MTQQTNLVLTLRTADCRNIRLMHLFNTGGGETENSSLTALKKKKEEQKEDKNPFSRNKIINWILCMKCCRKLDVFLNVRSSIKTFTSPALY